MKCFFAMEYTEKHGRKIEKRKIISDIFLDPHS